MLNKSMMNLKTLKEKVYMANMALNDSGLVLFTFGNVSGVDRESGVMVIKPSGVSYSDLSPDDMVPVSLETGETVDSPLNPSSDTATHLELYRAFKECGGVVHTHSEYATACAQARRPIHCMGTTHADYFHGTIPVTRPLTEPETVVDYEKNTGHVIVETFQDINPAEIPAVLVANHGPFAWGPDPRKAVENAVVLEYLAKMDFEIRVFNPDAPRPPQYLIDKHYLRKHGAGAYYGQKK